MTAMSRLLATFIVVVILAGGCSTDEVEESAAPIAETTTTVAEEAAAISTTTTTATTTQPPAVGSTVTTTTGPDDDPEIVVDSGLVYQSDAAGDWTLDVFSPIGDGPWPLVVVIPPSMSVDYAGEELARRGVVAIVADSWTVEGWSDPALHLYGEMNRAACAVGWAQAHAADYGGIAEATTVDGYSGGAMAAAWVGLGLADDSDCDHPIVAPPTALVAGENQFLFHDRRWDEAIASGDREPLETLEGYFDTARWKVPDAFRVALWSAARPVGEIRTVGNPPAEDSWIWLREAATPVVDDLEVLGAFEDQRIDFSDNARLLEHRLEQAGIPVQNETYSIGHHYADAVYSLIMSVQP